MVTHDIAVIPGDGIGKEVVPVSLDLLNVLADIHGGITFQFTEFPWGCDYYLAHGEMLPKDGINELKQHEQIFLGAVGDQNLVPDHISLWGLLIKIRRECQQVINLRPVKYIEGVSSPLANPNDFDFMVVRENSEGEYSEIGGTMHSGPDEITIQNAVFTRKAVERTIRFACTLAEERNQKVTSATKSNGIVYSMPFWDKIFAEVGEDYPKLEKQSQHIDALSAFLVTKPSSFDVIVGSNLFGDILTDIGAAIMGSIGIAPAANINLEGKYPSMFEPVHGSAPDIVGKGIANPIGQIWSAKMMLDHIGYPELATLLFNAMASTITSGIKTPDLGGNQTTEEVVDEINKRLLADS
ncbi:tartrate dehydrogenase [Gracilibacillus caseinilyticus]|uniref:D-malate dehydrogenase (decarboxylating) n=1 Tax=Gracilibacillus caseinilyticus TaxID=2932256 RepID=A0ABY4EXP5_9BACI|nr:tartrate dehydrogenase [Gracilibacillus caseinilyticus]UOQ48618.1 tartrate dehydrogenase [Gracilibacillus caseinilyticus]